MQVELLRKVTIQGDGQQSLNSLASSLNNVSAAQTRLATTSGTTATVTDTAAKRALSAQQAYTRQTLAVVEGARQQDQMARAMKVADAALQQGIITTDQHAQRVALLGTKYHETNSALDDFRAGISQGIGLLSQFGIALSIGSVVQWGEDVFKTAAALVDQADRVGVSASALQAYRAALADSGAASDVADTLVQKLSKTLGDAELGVSAARAEFNHLGVDWRQLATASNPIEAAVTAVTQAIAQIQDPAQRAAEEVRFFGRAGQEVGASLATLAVSSGDLVSKYHEQGRVLDEEVARKAQEASLQLTKASEQLEIAATPHITVFAHAITDLLSELDRLSKMSDQDFWSKLGSAMLMTEGEANAAYAARQHAANQQAAADAGVDDFFHNTKILTGTGAAANTSTLQNDQLDQFIAKQQLAATAAGLSTAQAALQAAHYEAAQAYLRGMGQEIRAQNLGLAESNDIYNQQFTAKQRSDIDHAVALKIQGDADKKAQDAADHVKETFGGYLAQLDQAAIAAGLTTEQQRLQAAIVKGAQIDEKAHGVAAKNLSQTYADAVKHLSDAQVLAIKNSLTLSDTNTVQTDLTDQIARGQALLATSIPDRAVEAQYLALSAKWGKEVADAALEHLHTVQAINDQLAAQARIDASINPYREDQRTIAEAHRQQGTGEISGGQATYAIGQTGLGQAYNSLATGLGESDPFGTGAGVAQQSQLAVLQNEIQQRQQIVDAYYQATQGSGAAHDAAMTAILEDGARKRAAIEEAAGQQRLQFASEVFSNLATMSQSSNATLAAIGKAAAIAQATIDGILAVQKALASAPPPFNYIEAAAVGIAAAVNVAKIAGFEDGGYTGNMPTNNVAGVVHGREWVSHAGAVPGNINTLAAMNAGMNFDRMTTRSPLFAAPANSNSGGMKVNIINNGSSRVTTQQVGPDELMVMIDDRIDAKTPGIVHAEAPKSFRAELSNPQSTTSRALERHTTARTKRT
ncbi:MAG TPA: hypothetical protein VHZ78_08545 [Rhizomicrobium sp.]|jgi:hypothetical protein|nr:hypothetical protein [Rhizomicrobium sp.]